MTGTREQKELAGVNVVVDWRAPATRKEKGDRGLEKEGAGERKVER